MTLAFALPTILVPSTEDCVVNVEVILYENADFMDDRPVFSVIPSCAFAAGTNAIESNKKSEFSINLVFIILAINMPVEMMTRIDSC